MVEMVASSFLAKPFFDGLSAQSVMYQHCAFCGLAQTLAHYGCQSCGSETLSWRESKGKGRVYSVTEVGRAPTDAFKALAPYTLAIVELDEGFKLMGHAQTGLLIGESVVVSFFEHDKRILLRFLRE
jgi:hypothetical protein